MSFHSRRLFPWVSLAGLATCVFTGALPAAAELPSDQTIRAAVEIVGRHQIQPLGNATGAPVAQLADAPKPPAGVMWNYPWGVTLYGTLRSTDVTGDKTVRGFILDHNHSVSTYFARLAPLADRLAGTAAWKDFTHRRDQADVALLLRLGDLDSCGAMGTALLEGMLRDPAGVTPAERLVAARVADWIVNKQERLADGTFWRPDLPGADNVWRRDAMWIDDLYMSCPFLVRWARFTGDSRHLQDAARQIINMAARVQDTDGLWFHAWFEKEQKRAPFKWGRANGWAMVATVEVLSALPDDHPERPALLAILRRHIEAVEARQAASGLWHQVLDHPELWEETSCSAMFAYSIARAVNRGWIPPENMAVARKAFGGLLHYITPSGVVQGTCEGTNIGLTLDYYAKRRRPDDNLHARGVVLLAGTEILASRH